MCPPDRLYFFFTDPDSISARRQEVKVIVCRAYGVAELF